MSAEAWNLAVQTVVAAAAVGAAIAALVIAARDRENARRIASEDRRVALEQAKLMFDLDALTRLLANLNRAGSADQQESRRMGAEALTLVGVLGPDLLPEQWEKRIGDEAHLRELAADLDFPDWKRSALETQFAVNKVTARIAELTSRTTT